MVRTLHVVTAWVAIVGNGLAGAWALAADRVEALRRPALWWWTAAVELAVVAQVVLGVVLVAGQGYEAAQFHQFYGYVAVIAIAIIYSYRASLRGRLHLLYGLGGLFVMGLGIRALLIGPTT